MTFVLLIRAVALPTARLQDFTRSQKPELHNLYHLILSR